jgi:hypothetical protein
MDYRAAWRALLVRTGILVAGIAILMGISAVVRGFAFRHVHDLDTRQM